MLKIKTVYKAGNRIFSNIETAQKYMLNLIIKYKDNKPNIVILYQVIDIVFTDRRNAQIYLSKKLIEQQYKIRHNK